MAKTSSINLDEVEALAAKGYSITMICDAIGINRTTAYKKSDIINAIKTGHATARQKVIDDLMSRSEADTSSTASIYLSKQLKCFDEYFPTSSPKTPGDALRKISDIYIAVSRNELTQERGNYLVGFLEKYIKAYEISEMETRISKLEEAVR